MNKILVTGGAGYIGSHTILELLKASYEVVVIDNLSNCKKESLLRVQKITGKNLKFYKADLLDVKSIENILSENEIESVIHFAALKAVGESVEKPLRYYENNITGTINLIKILSGHGINNFVFSSSATVYGSPEIVPIKENAKLSATNPYGQTKLFMEQILKDVYKADNNWDVVILRYFNPVGAHESGMIGEDPNGIPNNLMPFISQVAVGKRDQLNVYGDDYDTPDGAGIRDYIHVVDLAKGHIAALKKLESNPGYVVYNLGTGKGYSVFEVINAFEKASGKKINFKISDRRPGDIAKCFADPSLANKELFWKAVNGIDEICKDTWRWQSQNPNGY